jgi:membrane protein YdbS with pleckstrin-like domain
LSQAAPPVLYNPLDPRVVKLWRIHSLITSGVLLGVTGIAVVILGLGQVLPWEWMFAGWVALAALRVYFLFWHQQRLYRAWGYRLDGKVLETRHGIWFRQLQLLPLPRLQHVDLHSGPIERSLGLASLLLHTAGTHEATIVIPGLDANEAVRLRDHLVVVGGDDGV